MDRMHSVKHVGNIINAFLVCASSLFIWYSSFRLKMEDRPLNIEGFNARYFDSFIPFGIHYVIFASFAYIFCAISINGYMTADDISAYEVAKEILYILLSIIVEFLTMYYFHHDKRQQHEQMAQNMYNGVVLYHEATKNESNVLLRGLYNKINDHKWRCCGIYSWKDAESFRPRGCCPRGYREEQGKGLCHPRYGAYPISCVEMRKFILDRHFNKYTLFIVALILVQFLGIVLCGMHLFMIMQLKNGVGFRRKKKSSTREIKQ